MLHHFVINLVLIKDNKVLIEKSPLGNWKLPGGHIAKGEDLLEACRREAKEELDCDIQVIACKNLIDIKYSYPKPLEVFKEKVEKDSGYNEQHENIGFVFAAKANEEPRGLENQEIRWCSIDELRKLYVAEPIIVFAKAALELPLQEHSLY